MNKNNIVSKVFSMSNQTLMRIGIWAEIAGILLMSIIFLTHMPLIMVFAIPVGSSLIGLGLLCWACFFVRTL
jgi:hypothetical protein